jgi:uncharacterized heparinase superfamily protein
MQKNSRPQTVGVSKQKTKIKLTESVFVHGRLHLAALDKSSVFGVDEHVAGFITGAATEQVLQTPSDSESVSPHFSQQTLEGTFIDERGRILWTQWAAGFRFRLPTKGLSLGSLVRDRSLKAVKKNKLNAIKIGSPKPEGITS